MDSAPRFTKSTISGMGRSLDERFRKGKEKNLGRFPHLKVETQRELKRGRHKGAGLPALLKVSGERGQEDWDRVYLVPRTASAIGGVIPIKHDREEKLFSGGGLH